MRQLLLGPGWFPDDRGGASRYFRDLFEGLRREGASARAVVVGGTSGAPRDAVVSAGSAADPLWRRLVRFDVAVEGLAGEADLVDVHFALYAFLPLLRGRLRGKRVVVHFHGPWAEESALANPGIPRLTFHAKRAVERAVYRRADALITLSAAFKRILVERYGISPWVVHVIPPGVDLERFSTGDRGRAREALDLPAGVQIACCVRRLTPRTGVDGLLRAWARLEGDRLLLVAGVGPERARLEALARQLGLGSSLRFLGLVSDEELVEIYRAADVSVVPSVALEGFGLAALESLACGTPVVATDVGGLPEALAQLRPRCVVPAGDHAAMAARLAAPLPDRTACRAVAENYTWERAIERHRAVYEPAASEVGRPLRLVYLDHSARLSGAELALLRLLPALDGVQAHVILGEDGPLVDRLLEAGVSVEVMPLGRKAADLPRAQVRPVSIAAAEGTVYALRLARRLRRLKPDLVHTNSLKAAYYGGLAGRIAGIPVVTHVHDRLADDYLPSRTARLTRAMLARFPRSVIAPSRTVGETVGRRVEVIPCATGSVAEHRDDPTRPFTVGMVGRIAPWKGQGVFLEAFAQAFAGGDARAVVIGAPLFGTDEERYLSELRESARLLKLDGRLRFTGFVDDPAAELAQLDVLVHASIIPEPFGQVIVEGMAAGLPVVAADAGGPTEIISDGTDGLLYPPGDASALAQALGRLAEDAELRTRLGGAARVTAREFQPSVVAPRIRAVYDRVLASSSADGAAAALSGNGAA